MKQTGNSVWWCVIALAGFITGAARAAETEPEVVRLDGVAAYVNEHVITISDVLSPLEPVRRQLTRQYRGEALAQQVSQAYTNMLNNLVERYLILDAYAEQDGRIPDWAIDQRADEVIAESFDNDRAKLMSALAQEEMTYDEWRDTLREHMIVQSMRRAHVDQNVSVKPAEVRAYYDAHPEEFHQAPRVRVRMIALTADADASPTERETLAQGLVKMAREGHDFALLARQHSSGSHAKDGGDWGWIDPDRELAGELASRVKALKPGEVSDPIPIAGNQYIVKLEGRRGEAVADFASVQAGIERKLRSRAGQAAYDAWIARLKRGAYVRILAASSRN